jgi:hypothetical protein
MAPGVQNSYARSLDGDCEWLKQPNVSGNASNNRKSNISDILYELNMVNPTTCGGSGGSVSIYVRHSDYTTVFPMNYTLVFDVNGDRQFDFADRYSYHVDASPPFIEIDNLEKGDYRVTVSSVNGCYLKTFEFSIITCNPGTLPVRLLYFKNAGTRQNQQHLEWLIQEVQNLQSIVVEKSTDGVKYVSEKIFSSEPQRGDKLYSFAVAASPSVNYFRLKITQKNGSSFYSAVVQTGAGSLAPPAKIGPSPATDKLNLQVSNSGARTVAYSIYNTNGLTVQRGNVALTNGENSVSFSVNSLVPGTYQLHVTGVSGEPQPISFRFVKH